MPKKNCYQLSVKLAALDYLKIHKNVSATARMFSVDQKRIRDWRTHEEELRKQAETSKGEKRKRLNGGGKKIRSRTLEEKLKNWICYRREQRLRVSRKMIQRWALEFSYSHTTTNDKRFNASNGWLDKFIKRSGFTIRKRTTIAQKAPEDYVPKIVKFISFVENLRSKNNYKTDNIFVMDETPVWVEPVSCTTVEAKGVKSVSIKSTGHEKVRITVILTARADGTKLPPYIVIPRKREIKELANMRGVIFAYSDRSWMDDSLTADYLKRVIGQFSFNKRLLIWDAFRCHLSQSTKQQLRNMKIDTAVIPGGCTSFIQAPDVSWNKSLKSKLSDYYEDWTVNGVHTFTKGGNQRPPTFHDIAQWVHGAWNSISVQQIEKSMKTCAITTSLDGSEDHLIQCFQSGQTIHGLEILKKTRTAFSVSVSSQSDFEEDSMDEIDADSEEIEENHAEIDGNDESEDEYDTEDESDD